MKKHIANLLGDSIRLYITNDCDKQAEAVVIMVVFDILQTILKEESLGDARIDLVKKIAAIYEIDIKI